MNFQPFLGIYRLSSSHFVGITQWDHPTYMDYQTGAIRAMFPSSETSFFCGPAHLIPSPVELRISFAADVNGQVEKLILSQDGKPDQTATKIPLIYQPVTFKNGGVTLSGTLIMPTTNAPHPALISVHGSGAQKRSLSLGDFFAAQGIAVLAYDKRGVGESTGDWKSSTLDDLTGDVIAGLKFLQSRHEIDRQQIGLIGISQAGWIIPKVVSRLSSVAFVIMISAPGISPNEQELHRVQHQLRADEFAESDIEQAVSYSRLIIETIHSGQGFERLVAVAEKAHNTIWGSYVFAMSSREEFETAHEWGLDYLPTSDIEKIRCPVLALWGEKDMLLPVAQSFGVWDEALCKGGNNDRTLLIFPKTEHSMFISETGRSIEKDWAMIKGKAPEYYSTMANWLVKHVRLSKNLEFQ